MTRVMYVDEAREVCQERSCWGDYVDINDKDDAAEARAAEKVRWFPSLRALALLSQPRTCPVVIKSIVYLVLPLSSIFIKIPVVTPTKYMALSSSALPARNKA